MRALRVERGMTLQELAGQLKLSHQQLQKYEKGTNQISAARLQQISQLLKAPSGYFSRFFEYLPEGGKTPRGFSESGASYGNEAALVVQMETIGGIFSELGDRKFQDDTLAFIRAIGNFARRRAGR